MKIAYDEDGRIDTITWTGSAHLEIPDDDDACIVVQDADTGREVRIFLTVYYDDLMIRVED